MKICYKCKLVYDEHDTVCDRCEDRLAHYEPGHDIDDMNIVFPEGAKWVILETLVEEYVAQSHVDYLKSRHIPALKIINQKGVLSEIYLGKSVFGYDVFVPEKIYDEAKEKLEAYLNAPYESGGAEEDQDADEL